MKNSSQSTASSRRDSLTFNETFRVLNEDREPFPWQGKLFELFEAGDFENCATCNLPTGLGKTSIIAIWLIALARNPQVVPRRLVYVVNRRTVVDQATDEALRLRDCLPDELRAALATLCSVDSSECPLAISTLRGQLADNGEWSSNPARPAIIVGTVDMIGSRLLFGGYGIGFKAKPMHAGFLAQDSLLIHDEAHLEPAFQDVLVSIQAEQRRHEYQRFHVIELTATSRSANATKPFTLTPEESSPPASLPTEFNLPLHTVWKRLRAHKQLVLRGIDDEKSKLAESVADIAVKQFGKSGAAVLIFVRSVEDVEKIRKKLPKGSSQQLTGTLRGFERDRLAKSDSIFGRFLGRKESVPKGTVFLVCTSAGEVGVNISADHMVCDLTTFDSMAQRFGRVNRFGANSDSQIHIVHPTSFEDDDMSSRRAATLKLLRDLSDDGSPFAIAQLDADSKQAAYAAPPELLPTSDILFDAWALTTIREKMPGRPPLEPYLHGISDTLPETHVAWRQEVEVIRSDDTAVAERYPPQELLEDYPLKPHELLHDRSDRVFKHLTQIAERCRDQELHVWLVDDDGTVEVLSLNQIAHKDRKERINYRTVVLPPCVGGLSDGVLTGASAHDPAEQYDIADEWYASDGSRLRCRVDEDKSPDWKTPDGSVPKSRLVRVVDLSNGGDADDDDGPVRRWCWYEVARNSGHESSRTAHRPVGWQVHTDDVVNHMQRILSGLTLEAEIERSLLVAARCHDLGKQRELWQRSIGNPNPQHWLAKSGGKMRPREFKTSYRHEFGSLRDAPNQAEFAGLSLDQKELVLHLIAAHHGRARPYFPEDEVFDPSTSQPDAEAIGVDVPLRFARLQRKYGRWGLAYLESLLRAADYAASSSPSQFEVDVNGA